MCYCSAHHLSIYIDIWDSSNTTINEDWDSTTINVFWELQYNKWWAVDLLLALTRRRLECRRRRDVGDREQEAWVQEEARRRRPREQGICGDRDRRRRGIGGEASERMILRHEKEVCFELWKWIFYIYRESLCVCTKVRVLHALWVMSGINYFVFWIISYTWQLSIIQESSE